MNNPVMNTQTIDDPPCEQPLTTTEDTVEDPVMNTQTIDDPPCDQPLTTTEDTVEDPVMNAQAINDPPCEQPLTEEILNDPVMNNPTINDPPYNQTLQMTGQSVNGHGQALTRFPTAEEILNRDSSWKFHPVNRPNYPSDPALIFMSNDNFRQILSIDSSGEEADIYSNFLAGEYDSVTCVSYDHVRRIALFIEPVMGHDEVFVVARELEKLSAVERAVMLFGFVRSELCVIGRHTLALRALYKEPSPIETLINRQFACDYDLQQPVKPISSIILELVTDLTTDPITKIHEARIVANTPIVTDTPAVDHTAVHSHSTRYDSYFTNRQTAIRFPTPDEILNGGDAWKTSHYRSLVLPSDVSLVFDLAHNEDRVLSVDFVKDINDVMSNYTAGEYNNITCVSYDHNKCIALFIEPIVGHEGLSVVARRLETLSTVERVVILNVFVMSDLSITEDYVVSISSIIRSDRPLPPILGGANVSRKFQESYADNMTTAIVDRLTVIMRAAIDIEIEEAHVLTDQSSDEDSDTDDDDQQNDSDADSPTDDDDDGVEEELDLVMNYISRVLSHHDLPDIIDRIRNIQSTDGSIPEKRQGIEVREIYIGCTFNGVT